MIEMPNMPEERQAEVYSAFADIYDQVMRDVDYDSWAEHIIHLADRNKTKGKRVLDLACGTGSITFRLARKGYDVTGVDRSERMLEIARDKAEARGLSITFLQGTMQSFASPALGRNFDLITCIYDSLNYVMDEEGVVQCFREVWDHLRPGGVFIFDVTTEYNLLHNFSGYTYAENLDRASYIWENDYNLETKVCSSKVTVFQSIGNRYTKEIEIHTQKVYATSWLIEQLNEAGFEVHGTFHNLTEEPVSVKCERIHFLCKKR